MWGTIKRFGRKHPPVTPHLQLGERGERLAAEFLQRQGYKIVVTNFVAPIGEIRNNRVITGEIDIVAYDESSSPFVLTFIEVKTRSSSEIAAPESAVDLRKQRQIIRASKVYRRLLAIEDERYRFDVVSIVIAFDKEAELKLFKGYFKDAKFGRSKWFSR